MRSLVLVFILFPLIIQAQWQEVGEIYTASTIALIADDSVMYSVGNGINVSSDNGNIWSPIFSGKITAMLKLDRAFLIGHRGDICYLRKKSSKWELEKQSCRLGHQQINDILFMDSVLVVGSDRGVYLSLDSGKSFTFNSPIKNEITTIESYNGEIYIGTGEGLVYVSSDTGKSWNAIYLVPGERKVSDIMLNDSIIIIGSTGGIFRYSKLNNQWLNISNGIYSNAYVSSFYFKEDTLYALGNLSSNSPRSMISYSIDFGRTWFDKSRGLNFGAQVSSILKIGSTLYCSYKANAGLYKYNFSNNLWKSENWNVDSTNSLGYVNASLISFKNTLLTNGTYGIYMSKDQGVSWESKNEDIFDRPRSDIIKFKGKLFILTPYELYFLNHPDSTWKIHSHIPLGNDLAANDSVLVIASSYSTMISNGDTNWQHKPMITMIPSIYLFENNLFKIERAHFPHEMSISEDYGDNWKIIGKGLNDYLNSGGIGHIHCKDNICYTSTSGEGSVVSYDKGESWYQSSAGLIIPDYSFNHYISTKEGVVGLTVNNVYLTKNNGDSWIPINSGFPKFNYQYNLSEFAIHDNYLFVVGSKIWKRHLDQITSISPVLEKASISLYPNPTKGIFSIDLENHTNVHIEIYSSFGRIAHQETISNSNKFTITLPLSLVNGVYIVKLISKDSIHTQKLILQRE